MMLQGSRGSGFAFSPPLEPRGALPVPARPEGGEGAPCEGGAVPRAARIRAGGAHGTRGPCYAQTWPFVAYRILP